MDQGKHIEVEKELLQLDIDKILEYKIYPNRWKGAQDCIVQNAALLGFDGDRIRKCLEEWVSGRDLPFVLKANVNDMWRAAHRIDEWREFSEVALRFVTCATSEADVERLISVHRDMAGKKSTRLSHRTIQDRLQLRISRPRGRG
jgi:hypothetical protein